jgi:solute carrier family 30 (zinc transporter), member 1
MAILTLEQWLRAEILGAFFNAVFLIALCLSIVLEAITRLIDPPEISNPMLILIVGSLGLVSNLAGFFVLGGHGHSHGGEEHDHEHEHSHAHGDKIRSAEEGHSHEANGYTHTAADESGRVGDILPEAAVAGAAVISPDSARHIRFTRSDETASTSKGSEHSIGRSTTKSSRHHRRRASSIRANRLSNIETLSIHPASFRQEIIAASRPSLDGIESEDGSDSEEAVVEESEVATETSPLISKASNGNTAKPSHDHDHDHAGELPRSWHADHNHNKPKKPEKSAGHNHGDMGMRAMVLHVIGDALGNVGVIASALIIWLTPWSGRFYADPAVSLFITLIILWSTVPLTAATAKILLQATPDHLDVNDIKEDIEDIPGIISCHHVHIWQLSDSQIIASMHIQVEFPINDEGGSERYMEVAKQARECLHAYGIHSATIQPEFCLDKARSHAERGAPGFDGPSSRKADDPSCLLECVNDCGKGCCSTVPSDSEAQHDHSDHKGHSH